MSEAFLLTKWDTIRDAFARACHNKIRDHAARCGYTHAIIPGEIELRQEEVEEAITRFQPPVNYRELLKKYMDVVAHHEGTDFTDYHDPDELREDIIALGITPDDMRELQKLSKEERR